MIRGIKQQVDLFEMFMQTQMWKWTRKNLKTGQNEIVQVQGALRVIPFGYEYVFPEECLNEVLTMLNIDENSKRWNLGKFRTMILRMMLGKGTEGNPVEPIPKYEKVPTNKYVELRGVAIYPIGIKKDAREEIEEWGFEQEML